MTGKRLSTKYRSFFPNETRSSTPKNLGNSNGGRRKDIIHIEMCRIPLYLTIMCAVKDSCRCPKVWVDWAQVCGQHCLVVVVEGESNYRMDERHCGQIAPCVENAGVDSQY